MKLLQGLSLLAAVAASACVQPPGQPRTAAQAGPPRRQLAAGQHAAGTPAESDPAVRAARLAPPGEVYRSARDLVAHGHADQARAILRARVAQPRLVRGAASEQNAQLLAMLGELAAAERPASDASLFRAEAYLAWAIAADPCMGEYWHLYMRVRLARAGYSGVLSQLQHQEPIRYPATAIGFSHATLDLPWTDTWLYLRGLLYAETDDPQRALENLTAFKLAHNTCPVDQTLGELYQSLGRSQEAVTHLTPASDTVPGRRSPMRYYVLGLARKAMGDTERARKALLEASRLDPTLDPPRRALLQLDWQLTGDSATEARRSRDELAEHPADLASWLTWWEIRYRNGVAPQAEFQRFTAEVGEANQGLSQPAIARAVSLLWDGDDKAAAGALAGAAAHADDTDLRLATFLVALCRLDAATAREALEALQRHDAPVHGALLRCGAPPLLAQLETAAAGPAEKLARVDEYLLAASREAGVGLTAGAVGQACVHGAQGAPDASRPLLDTLFTQILLLGQRQTAIERRLVLNEAAIRGLNDHAVRILARVTGLEKGQLRQQRQLVLQDAQLQQLAHEQQEEAKRLAVQLAASERRLTAMIERQDARMSAALDSLAGELTRHAAQLDQLARAAHATRAELEEQQREVAALKEWRSRSGTVAGEAGKLSTTLARWSSVVSIGPQTPIFSINLLGLLKELAELAGA